VHWPDEQAWFCGHVTHFDALTGRHHVSYDDGDSEELLLGPERIEWIQVCAPADVAVGREDTPEQLAHTAHLGGCRLVRQDEDAAWPRVGDLLWGRVKVRAHALVRCPSCCLGVWR
jgi:hypothetical protein